MYFVIDGTCAKKYILNSTIINAADSILSY